ncbi:MAG: DUF885 domain-containing protein [Phycisphaerales bacterium]
MASIGTLASAIAVMLVANAPPSAGFARPPQGATSATTPAPPTSTVQLDELLREYDAWRFHEHPEQARERGLGFDPGSVTEEGVVPRMREDAQRRVFLDELATIDANSLSETDRLDLDVLRSLLENAIEGFELGDWLVAVTRFSGPQWTLPRSAQEWRFDDESDYARYLQRLTAAPGNLRSTIEVLRLGLERGRTPPRVVMADVPAQFDALLHGGGLDALAEPFGRMPSTIPPARRAEILAEFEGRLRPAIREATEELASFLTTEYIPRCAASIAASDQPDGQRWYAHRLRVATTTSLGADEINAIGLAEVRRIRADVLAAIHVTDWYAPGGTPDRALAALDDAELFSRFLEFVRTSPRFRASDASSLLARYRDLCKRVDPTLPRFFGALPRLTYGVRGEAPAPPLADMPAFAATERWPARYQPGTLARGEPAWLVANTSNLEERPTYEMVPLALREAVPGRHLQVALAQERDGVRETRRRTEFAACVDGWGLYCERLGVEMGMYADPYDDVGRLMREMSAACRLVVDTGMHAKGMSRDDAIRFLREHVAIGERDAAIEVDRCIARPGDACAETLGALAITRLRRDAEAALGERFSLRAFHDAVLADGELPLWALEANVRRRMDARRNAN